MNNRLVKTGVTSPGAKKIHCVDDIGSIGRVMNWSLCGREIVGVEYSSIKKVTCKSCLKSV